MKRLKKLALVSASALMLMSASVSTIDAVNGTVLATKKSKKGLKLHWFKRAVKKPLFKYPQEKVIFYSKFTKHPKWYATKGYDTNPHVTGNFLTNRGVMYVGYVYINHHKYYIPNNAKHVTMKTAAQKTKYFTYRDINDKNYMLEPGLVVDRALDVDNKKVRPMVYTTNNEPMKVYLHHVYQGDPNSRIYTKDDTERSFCLLPHTTFLLRKDIKPFTHNNEQYYSILMPTNGMIEKDAYNKDPNQWLFKYDEDDDSNYKYPQQYDKIQRYINKNKKYNSENYNLEWIIKKSDLESLAHKGGVYNSYEFSNFRNK